MQIQEDFVALEEALSTDMVESIKTLVSNQNQLTMRLFYKTIFHTKPIGLISSNYENDLLTLNFSQPVGVGKTLIPPMALTKEEARICCHHITFECIANGHQETSLRNIFDEDLPGALGNLTPDYHYYDSAINILEFTTTMSKDKRSFINAAQSKISKYMDVINDHSIRTGKKSTFNVIVVGREGVMSTLDLPGSVCSELIFRYRFSLKVVEITRGYGLTQATDEEVTESAKVKSLIEMFEGIDFHFDEAGEWTKENYDRWVDDISETEKSNLMMNYIIAASRSQARVEQEVNDRSKTTTELKSECNSKIRMFKTEMRNNSNVRLDMKPVTIFPLIIPKARHFYYSVDFRNTDINIKNTSGLELAWSTAIARAKDTPSYHFEEDMSDLYKKSFLEGPVTSENRSSYKRVHIDMPEADWLELASRGVRGKKHAEDSLIKEKELHSKMGFDPDANTDDIEKFVNSSDLFETTTGLPGYISDYKQLISRANELAESTGTKFPIIAENVTNSFMRTKFFHYCCFVTEIATEVAMSLRQNCKSDDFILKTLKFHDILLLIKPTNSAGHIFFSLMAFEDSSDLIKDLPFTPFIRQGNVVITNFVSANAQQLSHWATCSANSLVLMSCWLKYYQIDISTLADFTDVPIDFKKMMNLSLLTFLEQKTSTEEVMTLFRYVSMECFKEYPGFCDTMKVMSKMPNMFRSRLTCWVFHRICDEATRLYGKGYKIITRKAENKDKTSWVNLKNPYTTETICDPAQLVNLFYLGYLRNKHTRTSTNQDLALISKILKGEMQYWKSKDKDTLGSCYYSLKTKHNPHNYDVGFMKLMADTLKQGLEQRLGTSDPKKLEDTYLKALSNHSIDSFMTLKASSSFKPGDEDLNLEAIDHKLKEIKRLNKLINDTSESDNQEDLRLLKHSTEQELKDVYHPKPRPRVIEEFSKIIVNYNPPSLYIKESIDICEKHGLMIDIFKKPQQGGLREIYVITRESRMIQFAIETLSRLICSEFESETMTHPKNKVNLLTNHGVQVRGLSESLKEDLIRDNGKFSVLNSNSSKDKKSWNNTNSPSKFAIILLRLMPKRLHPFIFNSLKLWDKKNMLLPEGIRNLIIKGKKWEIGDPTMNEFINAYSIVNDDYKSIIHEGKPYITIKTGMMQGILHFTSSLCHTGFNLLMKSLFKNISKRYKWVYNGLFTHLESSDDSAYLKTILIDPKYKAEGLRFLYTFELFTTELSKLSGFHESFEKSSHHSSRVVEFNSEFCFDNQVNKPDMKFAFACLRIPENESLSETCYQYKCLSSACLESGSNIMAVHFIQRAQALIHYTTMGLNLNPFFNQFVGCLVKTTDPGLGFFPLDPCMLAGIVDHQFNVWMLMKGNPVLASKTAKILETEKISSFSCGTVLKSAVLQFGDRKRWRRIVDGVEENIGKLDYRSFVKEHPHLLFLRPETSKEIVAYHFLKLYTPSVISSLGNVGRMDRMLIRGGYMIQNRCLTVGSLWDELLENCDKTSMYKLTIETIRLAVDKLTTLEQLGLLDDQLREDLTTLVERLNQLTSEGKDDVIDSLYLKYQENKDSVEDKILTVSQQNCLFPQMHEYLSILSCHRTLCRSGHQSWHSSEKKRALVNVYTAPMKDLLSLENLCMIKWFSQGVHRLPRTLVARQWDNFKIRYPWLRDTFKESFESSNFENEISFANFIKEQSGKTRNLYVTSAPLKIEDGHSALYSLMTRHTWPGMLLKARNEDEVLNRISRDVLHPMATLAGLDMSVDFKIEVIKSLIQTDQYKACVDEYLETPPSTIREKRLRPILKCLRGETKTEIFNEIFTAKMGIVGSWTKRERYNSNIRSYFGVGEWLGKVDNLTFKIDTVNSKISKIHVSDGLLFRNLFNAIKEWMKETHLTFADSQVFTKSEVSSLVAMIRGGVLYETLKDQQCTPVVENRHLRFEPSMTGYKNIRVTMSQYAMQLKADMLRSCEDDRFGSHTEVTVISARLYDSDVLPDPMLYDCGYRVLNLLLNNQCAGDSKEKSVPTTRGASEVRFMEPESSGQSVQGLVDGIGRMGSVDPNATFSRMLSEFKLNIDTSIDEESKKYACFKRMLPSKLYSNANTSTKAAFLQTLKESLQMHSSRSNFTLPQFFISEGMHDWPEVMRMLPTLNDEELCILITCLSNRSILLIDLKATKKTFKVIHKGLISDAKTLFLSNTDIVVTIREGVKNTYHLLVKETPRQFKLRSRLVKIKQTINPNDYTWRTIYEDMREFKRIIQNTHVLSQHFDSTFKDQLKSWLCKSLHQQGVMTLSAFEQISKSVPAEDTEPEQNVVDCSDVGDVANDIDDFMEFLDTEDGIDLVDMFISEPQNDGLDDDAMSTTSSIEEMPIKTEELEALFIMTSALERYGKVKCSSIRLFDALVVRAIDSYKGFFVNPGSCVVKSLVSDSLFNLFNTFLEGALVKESYSVPDIPEEFD